MKKFKSLFIASAVALFGCLLCLYPAIKGFAAMEHYQRVCKNPLTVAATVTSHEIKEDVDDETFYNICISYVAEGVEYKDIYYNSERNEKELIPINTQFEVDVSPEDPSVLLSDLKGSVFNAYFFAPVILAIITALFFLFIRCLRSSILTHTKDTEIIEKDLKLTVIGRFFRPFSFILMAFFFFLRVRYHDVNTIATATLGILFCIIWLWCLYRTICDLRSIKNKEYEIRIDVLENKRFHKDSDGDTSYYLIYRSGEETWQQLTTRNGYERAKTGDTVTIVRLPGKTLPLLYYDKYGFLK